MASRIVVSVSGVTARTLQRCADLAAESDRRGVPLSLLVTPRTEAERPGAEVLAWVAGRAARGDAVVLHGFDHSADPRALGRRARSRAEFAALPAHEAGLRLLAGRAILEHGGLRTTCFVPPRWLASPGTLVALRRHGFTVCAAARAVHDLRTGAVSRGRVHRLGEYRPGVGRSEPWRCRALVLGVSRAVRRAEPVLQLVVDAGQLDSPGPRQAVLDAVDIALHHGAAPATYARLVGPVPAPVHATVPGPDQPPSVQPEPAPSEQPGEPAQIAVASPWPGEVTTTPSGASRANQARYSVGSASSAS